MIGRAWRHKAALLSHIIAAIAALCYAWEVSQTVYVTTGLQFVAPLLLIMVVHLGWLAITQGLDAGFAPLVIRRSLGTALGMVVVFVWFSLIAPQPSLASGNSLDLFLGVIGCLVMLLLVVLIPALVLTILFRLIRGAWRRASRNSDGGPKTRLFDVASLGLTMTVLSLVSIEGLPGSYAFDDGNTVVATQMIDADPAHVWAVMETATSADFPLPGILDIFPRPLAVITDEGTALGAHRQVQFSGREGRGVLSLRVVERDANHAAFRVISDTSPYANWIGFEDLHYTVTPQGERTKLDVSLGFRRHLAPFWFFAPTMRGAARLAMDVLARDVKHRAEM